MGGFRSLEIGNPAGSQADVTAAGCTISRRRDNESFTAFLPTRLTAQGLENGLLRLLSGTSCQALAQPFARSQRQDGVPDGSAGPEAGILIARLRFRIPTERNIAKGRSVFAERPFEHASLR